MDRTYLITDIIAKVIGLVRIVIEVPKNRTEQENSSIFCAEMSTDNMIKEIDDEPIKMMASMQKI